MEAASRTLVSWSLIRPITGITNRTAKSTVTLLKESTSTGVLGLRKRVVMGNWEGVTRCGVCVCKHMLHTYVYSYTCCV